MAETVHRLGKLALDIVENFVESKLGKNFVAELRAPTDEQIAITGAMQATADRLWEQWADEPLWNAIFNDLPKNADLLIALKHAVMTFYEHPTNTHFGEVLGTILEEHGGFTQAIIQKAVDEYISVLTEELALADEAFREKVRGLADVRSEKLNQAMAEDLHRIANGQTPAPAAVLADLRNLHQLPAPPADFTGREKEIRQITKDIQKGVTISGLQGMGGIGKTALSLIIAHQLKDQYPDGQIFLDLRGAHAKEPLTPAQAMSYLLQSFEPEAKLPEDEATLTALYCSVLENKKVLLFFDNAHDAEQVLPLLPPTGCLTLVTSRQHFTLPGLTEENLEILTPRDARSLTRKIAKKVKVGEADTIAKQCGYLPLAIRLAAGMLVTRPDWTAAVLIGKLQDALKLLGPVEASIQLSYDLVDEGSKLHFRQLGVFPAAFDRQAAGAVWETGEEETDKFLGVLLQASLLEYEPSSDRYALHDLLVDFSRRRLSEEEQAAASRRHAQHYLQILSQAEALYVKGGENMMVGLALFDWESEQIKSGQAWATEHDPELCNEYPQEGTFVINLRLPPTEMITWQESGLAAARQLKDNAGESVHLGNLGLAYNALGETRKAIEFYEKALSIDREIGNLIGEGAGFGNLGAAYKNLGEPRMAIEFYEKQLGIAREIGDRRGEGSAIMGIGVSYLILGETRMAIEFFEKTLVIDREIGDRRGEGRCLGNLGAAYTYLGEPRQAVEFYEKQRMITQEIDDRDGEGKALGNLGVAYFALGETHQAIDFIEKRIEIARAIGDRRGEGTAMVNMGIALNSLGEQQRGIELVKQALKIFNEIESPYAELTLNILKEWGVM